MRRPTIAAALALAVAGCATRPPAAPPPLVISRADTLQAALAPPPGGGVAVARVTGGLLLTLPWRRLFEPNSYRLTAEGLMTLDRVAGVLADGDERITVTGLSDSGGNNVVNRPQSLNRAALVARRLIERGVAERRITVVGLGSARPIASNLYAEGRARNRRIEMMIAVD